MENEVKNDQGSTLLSVVEACGQLGVSKSTLNRLISERTIKSVKIGRRRLIPESAVAAYIQQLQEQ